MRILHTSDWHVGRTTYNQTRHPDFVAVLDEIVEIAQSWQPDVVIHAGDLLDHARVGHSDINLTVSCLRRLSEIAPVAIVAGNHDSTILLDAFQQLHAGDRIHFITVPRGRTGDYLTFTGRDGTVLRLGALPFVNAARAIDVFDDPSHWAGDYRRRIADIQRQIAEHLNDRLDPQREVTVFVAHEFVTGAGLGGSERAGHVTDEYATDPADIPRVDYAAFGHIHEAQTLPGPVVGRYAGSPLPLDFGELGQTKSVTMIDLTPGQQAVIEEIPLRRGRALRTFSGTLDALTHAADTFGDALCVVEINTDTWDPVLSQRVHEMLPHATVLQIRQHARDGRSPMTVVPSDDPSAPKSILDQFEEYVAGQNTAPAPAKGVVAVMTELLNARAEDREPAFAVEALLAPAPAHASGGAL